MDDRTKFIQEYHSGHWTLTELASRHGVSRKTAYKVLARFREHGADGLCDRSRARLTQEHRTPQSVERRIVELARRIGCFGPRKIRAILKRRSPEVSWPAKSTVGEILKRHGLVKTRGPRPRRLILPNSPLKPGEHPNDLWCTDFKGWCLSGDQERLEPFVLGDAFSRFSLRCKLVDSIDGETVWPIFESAFREFGLPQRIRSDNGPPFATQGISGLSRLSVRWLRLGIWPERITPGKPQQNGSLERFNLTLQLEAMSPPAKTRRDQELALERFRARYNHVRPHESLGDRTPAEVYQPSLRRFSGDVPSFEYESHVVPRMVHCNGSVKWCGREVFISETLAGERVGFEQFSSCHWSIRLGPLEIAILDEETRRLTIQKNLVWIDEDD